MAVNPTSPVGTAGTSASANATSLVGQQEIASNFQEFLQLLTTQLQIRIRFRRWTPTSSRSNSSNSPGSSSN